MKEIRVAPIIPLREKIVMPGMMLHFDIERKASIAAMEEGLLSDQMIFLTMQKAAEVEKPLFEDLEPVGTLCVIKQIVRLPEKNVRVMISGICRGVLEEIVGEEPYLTGNIVAYYDESMATVNRNEEIAMLRNLKELVELYEVFLSTPSNVALQQVGEIENVEKLIETVINNIMVTPQERQKILNKLEVTERYEAVCLLLEEEISILGYKRKFQEKVKEQVDKNQKEYLLREQMKVIREELGENTTDSDIDQFLEKLNVLQAKDSVKVKIKKEIDRFRNVSANSSESSVVRGYIETLLDLPWDKVSKDNNDIKNAAKVLEADHYGLKKVKERILEFLAVRTLTGAGDSPIICLVGPPGTGKTSIARSVARALDKKYIRICLGGVKDEAEIRGHRRTYVGAMPGRIAAGLKNAEVKNPLILLDEIDKIGSDYKGDPASALLEVLDSEQNNKFADHYVEIPIDLSRVLFIATANSTQTIPRPLLDRMEVIEVNSYTENEKLHIAKEHLMPKVIKRNGLSGKQLIIPEITMKKIINGYTREAGVRNLERKLGEVARKTAREILEENKKQVRLQEKNLEHYLGKERYSPKEANEEDEVGIVRGLAWTSVGGDTLQIEVNVMPGKGEIQLTGQLGDVMKESARAGISYIRSISAQHNIKANFFEKHDIHIHIPEGAVPKDGPSAGITMATAMLSAITEKKVKASVAMTGEITLRGRVLPIGGLKEKILAAKTAGIKEVLVPKQNKKDIEQMEQEILEGITIHFVENMEEVIALSFL